MKIPLAMGICLDARPVAGSAGGISLLFGRTLLAARITYFLHFSAYKCTGTVSCFGRLFAPAQGDSPDAFALLPPCSDCFADNVSYLAAGCRAAGSLLRDQRRPNRTWAAV